MKGTHSVQIPSVKTLSVKAMIATVVTAGLLAFSAGAFSAQGKSAEAKSQKPAHMQVSSVASAINLNKADVQTLAQLNGVGEKKAQDIIAYREANGGFKSVDDLLNVKGIGEKTLEKNRTLLSVN